MQRQQLKLLQVPSQIQAYPLPFSQVIYFYITHLLYIVDTIILMQLDAHAPIFFIFFAKDNSVCTNHGYQGYDCNYVDCNYKIGDEWYDNWRVGCKEKCGSCGT